MSFKFWLLYFSGFFYISYFFADTFHFSFVSSVFIIADWSIFITIALKSLTDNSNLCVMAIVFCSLTLAIQAEFFLVLGRTSDFLLCSGH